MGFCLSPVYMPFGIVVFLFRVDVLSDKFGDTFRIVADFLSQRSVIIGF